MSKEVKKKETVAEVAAKKADEAKRAKQAEMRAELNNAKKMLFNFSQTKEFKALPEEVQAAISKVAKKATSTRGGLLDLFNQLFPTVGATLDELELFKQTKMGRSEFRKKVYYALRKAPEDQRMWITLNEKAEVWTLTHVGKDVPEGWTPLKTGDLF